MALLADIGYHVELQKKVGNDIKHMFPVNTSDNVICDSNGGTLTQYLPMIRSSVSATTGSPLFIKNLSTLSISNTLYSNLTT